MEYVPPYAVGYVVCTLPGLGEPGLFSGSLRLFTVLGPFTMQSSLKVSML